MNHRGWAHRRRFLVIVIGLVTLCLAANGATITVTSTADSGPGSLRAAIASAANGDTINFSLTSPATILLSTPLTLGPSVTIAGPGASSLAINGGDSVVVLIVNAGATAAISGLTIEHGSSLLGGGVFNAGTLTLTGCVISNNTVGNQLGGGIFNAGTLNLISSTVSGNQAAVSGEEGFGGGIYNYQGTLTLTNTTVSGNSIAGLGNSFGGGIYNYRGTLTLTNSTISNNTVDSGSGGGIGNVLGTVTVTNSTISGNTASAAGGIANQGTLNLVGSTVSGNHASHDDGGITAADCGHDSCP